MMTRLRITLASAVTALALLPILAYAATDRLDDSASPRSRVGSQYATSQQGEPLTPLSTETSITLHFGAVHYKLATAKYIGKLAGIYFVVPANINGLRSTAALKMQWEGSGLFGAGFAKPGDRVLLWSGVVKEAWMTEALNLKMHVDLRDVRLPTGLNLGFETYFEIDYTP